MVQLKSFFSTKSMFTSTKEEEPPSNKEAYGSYLKMAWPCVLESVLLCMVNFIDTMMVSSLGENAIAAVGITAQPKFVLLASVFSLNIGITAVVARRKGENNRIAANQILKGIIILGTLIGLVMSTLGMVFSRPFMVLAGAEAHYLDDAVIYFQILSFGIFFQTMNLVINAAQRGSGKMRITMQTNMIANVVNVVFNYLLIGGNCGFPALGVKGAAIATSLGCIIACVVAVTTLFYRKGYLNIYDAWKQKVTISMLHPVFQVASSALVEQMCLRVGFFLYAMIVAKLGTTSYATHLICMTFLNISFSFGDGIGIAASTLVGQNLGAKKVDHAKMYGKIGQRVSFLVSTVIFIVFVLARKELMLIFSNNPEVILLGGNILLIVAFTTHIQTSQIVFNGCLRGAGDSRFVAFVSLASVTIVRPVITYLFCFIWNWGVYGAWGALFIDQMFRMAFAMKRFYGGKWSLIKL